jgi:phosphoglycerate dehydrogenase-like enzyme
MREQHIVVTYKATPEEKSLFREVLGIDAWRTEPLMQGSSQREYPFLDLPNVLGSPHNSAIVSGGHLDAARQAAENLKHFITGEKVAGIVRREDYLQLAPAAGNP